MAHHLPHINVRVFTVLVIVSLPLYALAAVMVRGTGQGLSCGTPSGSS